MKADPDEIYKVSELVDDLRDCGADQTILIIDSPHSDRLLNELRNWLPFLRPIKVVASSEYGPTAKLTKLWTEADLKTQCVDDIFKVFKFETQLILWEVKQTLIVSPKFISSIAVKSGCSGRSSIFGGFLSNLMLVRVLAFSGTFQT